MLKVYWKWLILSFLLASCFMFVQFSRVFKRKEIYRNVVMGDFSVKRPSFSTDETMLLKNQSYNPIVSGHIREHKGFLTIAIPTVKRKDTSYVLSTLTNLIENCDEEELKEITLLVFLADLDPKGRQYSKTTIEEKFQKEIDNGLIVLIEAPESLYPNFESIPHEKGKSTGKLKWQRKQNFDYAFMMSLAGDLNSYYLQLEDDVLTIPGYIRIIQSFIRKHKNVRWTCLEFSSLGFIAKLYHASDLEKLGNFLTLFNYENPNDVNYLHFNQINHQPHRIVRKPTIFLHKGYHSSFSEKKETRMDPLFESPSAGKMYSINNTVSNPPAKIISSFSKYQSKPEECYNQKLVYRTGSPSNEGKKLLISFNEPQSIYSVKVVTGSDDSPDDILQNGVLQIGNRLRTRTRTCDGIFSARTFDKGEVFIKLDQPSQFKAACVQIIVLKSQKNWTQFKEINVKAIKK